VLRIRSGMMPTLDDSRLLESGPELLAATKAIIGDLELFVSKQGPGPDKRLTALKAIIARIESRA